MYEVMLSDKKYGLSVTIIANTVLPSLTPLLVSNQPDFATYLVVKRTIQRMLDTIDKYATYFTVLVHHSLLSRHMTSKLNPKEDGTDTLGTLRVRREKTIEGLEIPNLVIRRPSVVQVLTWQQVNNMSKAGLL